MSRFKKMVLVLLAVVAAVYAMDRYSRSDRSDLFLAVAGGYGEGRIRAEWLTDHSRYRHVSIVNDRGEKLSDVYVRRPLHLAPAHRILMTYTGRKTGTDILDLIPEGDDLVLVAVQYPLKPPGGGMARLRWPIEFRESIYRAVAAGIHAVTYLERSEELDPSRILMLGVSFGASVATIQTALDERIPQVVIVHGGGDFDALARSYLWKRGHWGYVRPAAFVFRMFTDTFDPVHYAGRISPRAFHLIAARDDRYFPPECIMALYDAAGEPKSLTWTETQHVRTRRPDIIAEVGALIEELLRADAEIVD
jgi:hypothetical protein